MRILVVDSESGEVLLSPRTNALLETDLLALFDTAVPRWRVARRRRAAFLKREVERVAGELRQLTVTL